MTAHIGILRPVFSAVSGLVFKHIRVFQFLHDRQLRPLFRAPLGGAAQVLPSDAATAGEVGGPLRLQGAALEILDYAKKGYHGGRYTCVNLQNPDTVEFRMVRGTLKINTIFATLQMLDRVCDAAIFLSDDELKVMAWTTFVAGIQPERYPELVQYLKERRLYVNEPVESEVEV